MRSERAHATPGVARAESATPGAPRWIRPLLRLLSPEGGRGKLTTLIFHRVRAEPDALFPGEMHAGAFRERMRWIRAWFNVLPLEEAVAALAR